MPPLSDGSRDGWKGGCCLRFNTQTQDHKLKEAKRIEAGKSCRKWTFRVRLVRFWPTSFCLLQFHSLIQIEVKTSVKLCRTLRTRLRRLETSPGASWTSLSSDPAAKLPFNSIVNIEQQQASCSQIATRIFHKKLWLLEKHRPHHLAIVFSCPPNCSLIGLSWFLVV